MNLQNRKKRILFSIVIGLPLAALILVLTRRQIPPEACPAYVGAVCPSVTVFGWPWAVGDTTSLFLNLIFWIAAVLLGSELIAFLKFRKLSGPS